LLFVVRYFSYFTHLTYFGICGYFFAAGFQTALYARHGEKAYPLQKWPKALRFLHLALLSTVNAYRELSLRFCRRTAPANCIV
jgi:uncharacterized membrane protein